MNKDLSTTRKQQVYADAIATEDRLRMKWFKRNEQRLVEYAEQALPKKVTEEEKEKMISDRQERYQNVERKVRPRFSEGGEVPLIDPDAVYNVMRPVNPEVKSLLYAGTEKNGRKNYLHERVKILPENKYYFQECVNWTYGWKMWNHGKENPMIRYGRCRIIEESFYRKNNVGRDPDWYREPSKLSPTTCGF
ncbi:uncharacterized protein LOC108740312 [Agrilus planipennis]|uniref:Uncharacterized protein LOC108740312 n=1 Tax=Agrilus planipennis TaxID=224129 RepID=A0A1W4XBA5_AGRPL|nr:uncharacterized protein LOC108740312 [Agrilus planipennis]